MKRAIQWGFLVSGFIGSMGMSPTSAHGEQMTMLEVRSGTTSDSGTGGLPASRGRVDGIGDALRSLLQQMREVIAKARALNPGRTVSKGSVEDVKFNALSQQCTKLTDTYVRGLNAHLQAESVRARSAFKDEVAELYLLTPYRSAALEQDYRTVYSEASTVAIPVQGDGEKSQETLVGKTPRPAYGSSVELKTYTIPGPVATLYNSYQR